MKLRQKIMPFLWYAKDAEAAAKLYTSIFPNSKVDRVTALPAASPSGPPGSVKVVDFTLFGQPFQAMTAGKLDDFNHAVSFVVLCDDQAELDGYWKALLAKGGKPEMCGWLRDRFGVAWQIVPAEMSEWMASRDRKAAVRVSETMLRQQKLDVAELRAAFTGTKVATARRKQPAKPARKATRKAARRPARRRSTR